MDDKVRSWQPSCQFFQELAQSDNDAFMRIRIGRFTLYLIAEKLIYKFLRHRLEYPNSLFPKILQTSLGFFLISGLHEL
jgi:hypothetical protein